MMMPFLLVAAAIAAVILAVSSYNELSQLREAVRGADETLSASVRRKNTLAQEVAALAERIGENDRGTYGLVTTAMTQAAKEMAHATHPTVIFANLASAFPQLHHERGFLSAQKTATDVEHALDTALMARNSAAQRYNTVLQAFPGNVIASAFGFAAAKYRRDDADVAKDSDSSPDDATEERRRARRQLESSLDRLAKKR